MSEENNEILKPKKKHHMVRKIAGGATVVVGASVVSATLVPKLAGYINKQQIKLQNEKGNDDWGPELVKKSDYKGNGGRKSAN